MTPEPAATSRRGRAPQVSEADVKPAAYMVEAYRRMPEEMKRVIMGQTDVVDQMLIALPGEWHLGRRAWFNK